MDSFNLIKIRCSSWGVERIRTSDFNEIGIACTPQVQKVMGKILSQVKPKTFAASLLSMQILGQEQRLVNPEVVLEHADYVS